MLKNDKKADAIANLYRASYCIAKNDRKNGMMFIQKSSKYIDLPKSLLTAVVKDNSLLAEKVLDLYNLLKYS